jgi:hypothetical protein
VALQMPLARFSKEPCRPGILVTERAMQAGIKLLMNTSGVTTADIHKFIIAKTLAHTSVYKPLQGTRAGCIGITS